MKYIITRRYSFTNKIFEIHRDGKLVCTAEAKKSRKQKDQFNIKLSNISTKFVKDTYCIVEPDERKAGHYFIYSGNHEAKDQISVGQLSYQLNTFDSYNYTFTVGQKLYQVRSSDLRNRNLTIIGPLISNNVSTNVSNHPKVLFQVLDSFLKLNDKYRVNIYEGQCTLTYFAITILFYLHECRLDRYRK